MRPLATGACRFRAKQARGGVISDIALGIFTKMGGSNDQILLSNFWGGAERATEVLFFFFKSAPDLYKKTPNVTPSRERFLLEKCSVYFLITDAAHRLLAKDFSCKIICL